MIVTLQSPSETLVKNFLDGTQFINNNEFSMKFIMPSHEEIKAHLKEMK